MPDDLDNMIRGAMKVLDEQTPSGYFDAAPNQILSLLEDGMQQGTMGTMTKSRGNVDALMGPPVVPEDADTNPTPKVESSGVAPLPQKPVVAAAAAPAAAAAASTSAEREEDSGLHDIRNLAQSTKQRLSSRRITMNPPTSDDALASSSGSFANIALPQPAKMVALPDLEDLPSKQEVIAAQKAAAKARKNKPTAQPELKQDVLAPQATANAALAAMSAAPVAAPEAASVRQAFTLPSMERKKSKGPLLAVLGLGVAAAAGGFLMLGNKDKATSPSAATTDTVPAQVAVATPTPAVAVQEPASAPPPAPVEEAKAAEPEVAAAAAPAEDESKAEPRNKKTRGAAKTVEKTEVVAKADTKTEAVEAPKDIKRPDGSKGGEQQAEQSFDSLLKEAGVEEKKDAKPKLEKKSLSGDDFKKGMSAINAKAQGCYKGTQGTATVKLTIGPSGAVTKASVGGAFAGKPEAACVEAAVKGATFPAWDGGPQSFNYSYMLSD